MSKKKKKKFKAKLHDELRNIQNQPQIKENEIISKSKENKISDSDQKELKLVKKDIKNILIVSIILILVILGIYLISLKTNYITNITEYISGLLNIQ